eukprot:Skav235112  [mRNA]  locus=scaffold711:296799:302594:+ [translate_table: standard]
MESLQVHEQRRSQEEPEYTNQAAKGGLAKLTLLISLVAGRLGGALAELTLVLMGLAPLVMASVLCVVNLIGGLIYSKCPRCRPQLEDARQPSAGPGFEYSLLEGCCQSGRVCFWGCCCPSVLWSAMASSPKSRFWGLTFWQMLTLRLSLAAGALIYPALPRFWAGFVSLFGLSFFVMNVLHRQHLRQKFGLVHSTCGSVYDDVWTWFFCQPCATIQEALQVGYTGDPTLGWDDDSARDVGGQDEYEVIAAVKSGRISKPLIAWCVGTCASCFSTEVQFGHAGAQARGKAETAMAKNAAMKEPEGETPQVPVDYTWAKKLGMVRSSSTAE